MLMLASWMRSLYKSVQSPPRRFCLYSQFPSLAAISTPQGRNKTLSATCSLNRILNKIVYLLFKRYYSSAESSPLFIKKENSNFLAQCISASWSSQFRVQFPIQNKSKTMKLLIRFCLEMLIYLLSIGIVQGLSVGESIEDNFVLLHSNFHNYVFLNNRSQGNSVAIVEILRQNGYL